MQPQQSQIDEMIARIVEAAHPLRIIMFGSAARGELGPNSDLDVLVVMPNGSHRRNTAGRVSQGMIGFGMPVDVVVATPELLERHKDNIGLIYTTILREGKEIYAAGAN